MRSFWSSIVIKDDPEALAMFREAMAKQGERNDLDNNVIHVDTQQGNSRAYSIDRVKRECEPHWNDGEHGIMFTVIARRWLISQGDEQRPNQILVTM